MMKQFKVNSSWRKYLNSEFKKEYMVKLFSFLKDEERNGKIIYPKSSEIFSAFDLTKFEDVKVVIIGQDPYHGVGQAHGLSFSVKEGVKIPPSLRNIYKELNSDLGITIPTTGYLEPWAKQGILMINSCLTVEKELAASHKNRGWELFSDKVVEVLNKEREGLVFILWGNFAQKKGVNIDTEKHFVLKSVHPSPLSASRGFFGCRHFSKVNSYLIKQGRDPIEWAL